jgi:hypothetical protein
MCRNLVPISYNLVWELGSRDGFEISSLPSETYALWAFKVIR